MIKYEQRSIKMIELEIEKAYQGDCIWIRCIAEKNTNIVIDAGPSTFALGFKNLMHKIMENEEKIDLLVFSHIDDDHICGCIRYLQEEKVNIIEKIWINGFGTNIYCNMQEHSVTSASNLISLIEKRKIPIEYPIFEGKEYIFCGGLLKVIGPTEKVVLELEKQMKMRRNLQEHTANLHLGNIHEVIDVYNPDMSKTNRASIIFVLEFENKRLLFPGDSTSENILSAINKYYVSTKFDIVKLPHHGSPRNISRELIRQIKAERFIISTNKMVDKVTFRRFVEEREHTELMLNYKWWTNGYFTNDDRSNYIDTNIIVMKYIGDKKIIL